MALFVCGTPDGLTTQRSPAGIIRCLPLARIDHRGGSGNMATYHPHVKPYLSLWINGGWGGGGTGAGGGGRGTEENEGSERIGTV